tara:strand:+ start:1911 stop:2999 length:1089 start_codon:yes stop_codon:yes gene_type:complete
MSEKIIFGSSTPRSGGSLVTNILSLHPDVIITKDFVHFFRYIYKKYSPLTKKNLYKLVYEFCLRIKYRNKIIINPKEILKNINLKNPSYKNIYISISKIILKNTNKKIYGENANSEWNNVSNFLNLDKNFLAYQVIRDPRAVLMSWKNLTYEPGYKYLIIIFYWLDAIQELEKNKNYFKSRFTYVKFENIHSNPYKSISKLYKHFDLTFHSNFLNINNFKKQKKNKFIHINVSGYTNKKVIGFSKKRLKSWKKEIHPWEVALTQRLLKKYMLKYNYEIIKTSKKDLKKGIEIVNEDKLLKNLYEKFLKKGIGTSKRLSDPSKPENWSAVDTSKNIKLKFIDTPDYKRYMNNLKKINIKINKL